MGGAVDLRCNATNRWMAECWGGWCIAAMIVSPPPAPSVAYGRDGGFGGGEDGGGLDGDGRGEERGDGGGHI